MMRRRRMATVLLAALLAAALLPGCQEKFTRVNYETIYLGMDPDHVRDRLGEPARQWNGNWLYTHRDPAYQALIRFADGQVVAKRWAWGEDESFLQTPPAPGEE